MPQTAHRKSSRDDGAHPRRSALGRVAAAGAVVVAVGAVVVATEKRGFAGSLTALNTGLQRQSVSDACEGCGPDHDGSGVDTTDGDVRTSRALLFPPRGQRCPSPSPLQRPRVTRQCLDARA